MAGVLTMDEVARPHRPVLADRVTGLLATPGPGLLVDATVGAGGHAAALLEASGPEVVLLGLDRDPDALEIAGDRLRPFGERALLVHAAYDRIAEVVEESGLGPVLGVLYDLGVSSMQLDRGGRGFSFAKEAALDMRMDPTEPVPTAADLVNDLDVDALATLLRAGGEDRHPGRIARGIVAARPIATTTRLAEVVAAATPARSRRGPTHPATRTFQALRIAVNHEIDRFRDSLPQTLGLLEPGRGRVAVLAYHSLEDRAAKQVFAEATRGCICPPELPVCGCGRVPQARPLTKGAERPDDREADRNPRARSARLRAVERTTAPYPYPRT
jgi:16S rRNA (cytosine1402-N4)-methyltransferase